jgi:hypothetical protein
VFEHVLMLRDLREASGSSGSDRIVTVVTPFINSINFVRRLRPSQESVFNKAQVRNYAKLYTKGKQRTDQNSVSDNGSTTWNMQMKQEGAQTLPKWVKVKQAHSYWSGVHWSWLWPLDWGLENKKIRAVQELYGRNSF